MKKAAEFFNKVSKDSKLKADLKSAVEKATTRDGEVQAAVLVAKDAGFDVSAGELKALVVSVKRQSGVLSDDELEQVAGGVVKEVGLVLDEGLVNIPANAIIDYGPAVVSGAGDAAEWTDGAADSVASAFSGW